MKKNVSRPPSQLSSLPDFTALASVLEEMAQALRDCGQASTGKGSASSPEPAKPQRAARHPGRPMSSGARLPPSKRTIRKDKAQALAFNQYDTTAFADKELAKTFESAYSHGNFRDEIRYYYVPWYIVRFEHKFLRPHQQHTILDLLSAAHVELSLKSKLITYPGKEAEPYSLSSVQLGERIMEHLKNIETIYKILNSFKLVHKTTLPRRSEVKRDADL